MARGQRFELNLDPDSDSASEKDISVQGQPANFNLVKDIQERGASAPAVPPAPPQFPPSGTGFPKPKIRSHFRRQAAASTQSANDLKTIELQDASQNSKMGPKPLGGVAHSETTALDERARIDRENQETLAHMSEADIEQERKELLSGGVPGLTPSLIERLLRRADISQGSNETDATSVIKGNQTPSPGGVQGEGATSVQKPDPKNSKDLKPRKSQRTVTFAELHLKPSARSPEEISLKDLSTNAASTSFTSKTKRSPMHDPEAPPSRPPADLQPVSSTSRPPQPSMATLTSLNGDNSSIQPARELDPSSPDFLEELHSTYYPSLPTDPSKLSWLQPLPNSPPSTSPYAPERASLPPSSIRFDFRGEILPPSLAAQLPVSLGLHHHAAAPESAGYAIPELATLQRSRVASQRCVAIQTLGRILYRLGTGEFGSEGSELAEGLWEVVGRERVVESLIAEAGGGLGANVSMHENDGSKNGDGKDENESLSIGADNEFVNTSKSSGPRQGSTRTAWALANEAVWLWQRSGGRRGIEYQTR